MNQLRSRDDLKELFLRYSDEIYKYSYTRLGYNKEVAEDTVQDLFIRAWNNREKFDPKKGSIRTWLYAILRNLIIDTYRKKKVETSNIENESYDDRKRTDDEILVLDGLNKLNEEERELVLMRYMQGLSNKEIASVLNKSEGSIKVSVHRAMNKLREILSKE